MSLSDRAPTGSWALSPTLPKNIIVKPYALKHAHFSECQWSPLCFYKHLGHPCGWPCPVALQTWPRCPSLCGYLYHTAALFPSPVTVSKLWVPPLETSFTVWVAGVPDCHRFTSSRQINQVDSLPSAQIIHLVYQERLRIVTSRGSMLSQGSC